MKYPNGSNLKFGSNSIFYGLVKGSNKGSTHISDNSDYWLQFAGPIMSSAVSLAIFFREEALELCTNWQPKLAFARNIGGRSLRDRRFLLWRRKKYNYIACVLRLGIEWNFAKRAGSHVLECASPQIILIGWKHTSWTLLNKPFLQVGFQM